MQAFCRGTSFDSQLLEKTPVEVILMLRTHPDWSSKAMRGLTVNYFKQLECDKICHSPTSIPYLSPSLDHLDRHEQPSGP